MAMEISVPVKIVDILYGFQEAEGMLIYDDGRLRLELRTKDTILGIIQSDVQEYQIDVDTLNEINLERRWFRHYLDLTANSLRAFDELPGNHNSTLELKIKRKHKEKARELASRLRLELSEQKLRKLDSNN